MIEKVNLRQVLVIAGIGLAVCFMFRSCGTASPSIRELQTSTDTTMGAVKSESAGIGIEITRSQAASDNAAQAIRNAKEQINGSRATFNDFRAGINELERTLAECERLARENSEIIAGIDGSN